jgi:hypothetical protein
MLPAVCVSNKLFDCHVAYDGIPMHATRLLCVGGIYAARNTNQAAASSDRGCPAAFCLADSRLHTSHIV